jgi:hypothetical protein
MSSRLANASLNPTMHLLRARCWLWHHIHYNLSAGLQTVENTLLLF